MFSEWIFLNMFNAPRAVRRSAKQLEIAAEQQRWTWEEIARGVRAPQSAQVSPEASSRSRMDERAGECSPGAGAAPKAAATACVIACAVLRADIGATPPRDTLRVGTFRVYRVLAPPARNSTMLYF